MGRRSAERRNGAAGEGFNKFPDFLRFDLSAGDSVRVEGESFRSDH